MIEQLDQYKEDNDVETIISSVLNKGKYEGQDKDDSLSKVWDDLKSIFGSSSNRRGRFLKSTSIEKNLG